MPTTIAEMVAKGKKKFARSAPDMKPNYDAAKPRMKTEYGLLPFNARIKAAYNRGVDEAVYKLPDFDRWGRAYAAKMG